LLNKLNDIFVCACTAGNRQFYVNKREAKHTLLILCGTCYYFVHYFNWNLSLCSSAEAGIVLNLFLNFEERWASCSYKIVLMKKSVVGRVGLGLISLSSNA